MIEICPYKFSYTPSFVVGEGRDGGGVWSAHAVHGVPPPGLDVFELKTQDYWPREVLVNVSESGSQQSQSPRYLTLKFC